MTDTAEILAAVRTALACDPDEDVVVAARIAKEQAAREPMVVGLMRILDVLGWDEAGGVEPIEHARRVVADRETLAASLIEMRARAEKAEGDLLDWEQTMAAVAKEGRCGKVVVWSPGGSALSHYAVHAVLNKVAISFEPEPPVVGEPFLPPDGQADDGGIRDSGQLAQDLLDM